MNNDKRFIEESFPVKEVSVESAREKNIRHGHISTLHIWWARRPLASSRATAYAALIPPPQTADEWNRQRNFIVELSKWENSLNQQMIRKAREEILRAHGGKPPKVLDPFGGGGAIPLEALRLGCETYSNDYNPVAVLIQKCTLEYPQKYGKKVTRTTRANGNLFAREAEVNPLLEDVKKWGNWVLEEAKKDIGQFYPPDKDGSIPVGYIWARTIPCQNPACGAEIPLMRQFWLARKDKKSVALYPYVQGKEVKFNIVGTGYEKMPPGFDPDNGTTARAVATCSVCGATVDAHTTRKLFQDGRAGQRMVAVVLQMPGESGKRYRLASEKDMNVFQSAAEYLQKKRQSLMTAWGIDPVPDERIPTPCHDVDRPPMYGMQTWGDLFNARQKLALITFTEKVRQAGEKIRQEMNDEDYARAVVSYLGLGVDKLGTHLNCLVRWRSDVISFERSFDRQALGMVWDYGEVNPFSDSRGQWDLDPMLEAIEHCSKINKESLHITHSSATALSHPDNFFDAVFTDPPYYDNVGYANLADFFYVWLKRSLGHIQPNLFSTPVIPKKNEIVSDPYRHGSKEQAKQFFEDMLKKSFQEIYRVLKPNGIAVIVYAHKSTAGWETLINSLLDSGLVMTGAWPLHTEMQSRLNANETASLASSIYIVARKMVRQQTGIFNTVKEELKKYLNTKLDRLWQEGVSGADFFIAAIGSAIEVFGKYEQVLDYEGNIIRADKLLDEVRKISTDYAVKKILHNGFSAEISDMTRFYVLWRWEFGAAKVLFDDARKLGTGCSIDVAEEWNKHGFIKKEKEFIRVLGPHERTLDELKDSTELIDVLHHVLLLWEKGKRDEMVAVLQNTGFGKGEVFYRVAQAISETLPHDDREKKLLDGFLAGRERVQEEMKKDTGQRRLL